MKYNLELSDTDQANWGLVIDHDTQKPVELLEGQEIPEWVQGIVMYDPTVQVRAILA
jgi:hypothetical protein